MKRRNRLLLKGALLCLECEVVWCGSRPRPRFPCLPCSCFPIHPMPPFQTSCVSNKTSMPAVDVLPTSSRPARPGQARREQTVKTSDELVLAGLHPFQTQPTIFVLFTMGQRHVTSEKERVTLIIGYPTWTTHQSTHSFTCLASLFIYTFDVG